MSLYLLFGKYLDASDNIKITIVFTLKNFKNLQGRDSPYFLINMSHHIFKILFLSARKKKNYPTKRKWGCKSSLSGFISKVCLLWDSKSTGRWNT